jgi:Tol biopolymer transport system component
MPNPIMLLLTEERVLEARFLRSDGGAAQCRRVSWTSLRPGVASVDTRGYVIGITQGNGVIQADAGGGLVSRVVVQVTTDTFRFRRDRLSLPPAESDTLRVVVPGQGNRPIAGSSLQWATTNPNIAIVSTSGIVTGVTAGATEVVARGFGKDTRMPVVVHRPVAWIDVLPPTSGLVYIPLNGAVMIEVSMLDANEVVIEEAVPSWTIEDRAIISIDQATGRVTGRQMGTTRLIAHGPGVEAAWNVEVVGPNITIDKRQVGLNRGDRETLTASFMDDNGNPLGNATGLTWTTLDANIATVDPQGNVTGAGFGGTQIIATATWGEADTIDVYVQGSLLVTGWTAEGIPDLYSFNPGSMAVVGQITNDMLTEVAAKFSPDGTRIAYQSNAEGENKIFVMNADGSNPRRLTTTADTTAEDSPGWTPDGSRIVYSAGRDIWISNADGSNPQQLTSGEARDHQPSVSPDGQMIAYQSTTRNGADIYLMSIDGQQQRPVRETEELEMSPGWFPDGQLAYISQHGSRRNPVQVVVRLDLNTGAPLMVSPEDMSVQGYSVSPDGSTLAFTIQVQENRRLMRKLYIMPLTGLTVGTPVEVPRVAPVEQFFFPTFKR